MSGSVGQQHFLGFGSGFGSGIWFRFLNYFGFVLVLVFVFDFGFRFNFRFRFILISVFLVMIRKDVIFFIDTLLVGSSFLPNIKLGLESLYMSSAFHFIFFSFGDSWILDV